MKYPRVCFSQLAFVAVLFGSTQFIGLPKLQSVEEKKDIAAHDAIVQLQIFLDAQNFGPGKIDGQLGGFTKLSWERWQKAHKITPILPNPDLRLPELAAINPVYLNYTIRAEDLNRVKSYSKSLAAQEKLESLAYTNLTEEIAERFHCDVEFLNSLNSGVSIDQLRAGDTVIVPNVKAPFDLQEVINLKKEERKIKSRMQDAVGKKQSLGAADSIIRSALPANAYLHISIRERYLELRDGDKIFAGFPITPGSTHIPSPVGNWKIVAKTLMPEFRWDESMLMSGRRSENAYQLPPGPRSPVGIAWIEINKNGIGIHGTSSPDTIGRSASHGCIRLSNWDAFKLYSMVPKGTRVVIEP